MPRLISFSFRSRSHVTLCSTPSTTRFSLPLITPFVFLTNFRLERAAHAFKLTSSKKVQFRVDDERKNWRVITRVVEFDLALGCVTYVIIRDHTRGNNFRRSEIYRFKVQLATKLARLLASLTYSFFPPPSIYFRNSIRRDIQYSIVSRKVRIFNKIFLFYPLSVVR